MNGIYGRPLLKDGNESIAGLILHWLDELFKQEIVLAHN
jgi:hypothetical protein